MSDIEGPRQISVSRDALRADLAELELRLRTYLSSELALKASVETVAKLTDTVANIAKDVSGHGREIARIDAEGSQAGHKAFAQVTDLRQGNFPDSFKLAVEDLVEQSVEAKTTKRWGLRANKVAVIAIFISLGGLVTSVLLSVHSLLH